LTPAGTLLLQSVAPFLARLDNTVRQIRTTRARRSVSVATFPSFASLWLLPRLQAFQQQYPDIDIRLSTTDVIVDLDDAELDVAIRYCHPDDAPRNAARLFGEVLSPVVGAGMLERARNGLVPPLTRPRDLAQHTLLEEDDYRPSAEFLRWRHWLQTQGEGQLQPQRWIYLNFTYQQIQAAMAGQGVALGRLAMVVESLISGDLVEPFGPERRISSPYTYWAAPGGGPGRPEVQLFFDWVVAQGALTRQVIGEI
jgi:LysR family glycine cleavage system transcriptional activator